MVFKAVQQFQLRTVLGSEKKARNALRAVKDAGYNGIELNGFMIKKMPVIVQILTWFAGMPVGRSGKLNWKQLIAESGLEVISIHEDLGSIMKNTQEIITEARGFGTDYIVVTGMRRFDYSDKKSVLELADKLNQAGKLLEESGIHLLYHNHNCEFRKVDKNMNAFQLLINETDPEYVNFEFDSYWPTEAGCDALALMKMLGSRMKLYHINDRGFRVKGSTKSIIKSHSMELGSGNMDLERLVSTAKDYGVKAVILESHKNWVDNSPIKSLKQSAKFMNKYV